MFDNTLLELNFQCLLLLFCSNFGLNTKKIGASRNSRIFAIRAGPRRRIMRELRGIPVKSKLDMLHLYQKFGQNSTEIVAI